MNQIESHSQLRFDLQLQNCNRIVAEILLSHDQKLIDIVHGCSGQIEENLLSFQISSGERLLLKVYDSLTRQCGVVGQIVGILDDRNIARVIRAIRIIRPNVSL
jgi:hypothetical protein